MSKIKVTPLKLIVLFQLIFAFSLSKCLPLDSNQYLKVKRTFHLDLPPVNEEATVVFWKQDFAPPEIYEGFNGELILNRFSYLQIYDSEGSAIQKVGGYGQGPGEFQAINSVIKSSQNYLILDPLQATLSIFDKKFFFVRRFLLLPEGASNIVQDITVNNQLVATAQLKRESSTNKIITKAINLYSHNGKWQKALFNLSSFRQQHRNYPEILLIGHVLMDEKYIYFCLAPVNCIWKLDLNGQIVKEFYFGRDWWTYIKYNPSERKTFSLKKPAWMYDLQAEETGDRIMKLFFINNEICLQIKKRGPDLLDYCYVLVNRELSSESNPFYVKDFFPAGSGENCIFLARMIEFSSPFETSKAEIIKCYLEIN